MVALTRLYTWQRYEPALGENLELAPDKRFWLQLAVGLTMPERDGLGAAIDAKPADKSEAQHWADVLGPWVRLGKEPLTLAGVEVRDLTGLLEATLSQAGMHFAHDLLGQLLWVNSYAGGRELFYGRLSGGSTGTRGQ